MKSITLTQAHKSKLLEMCKVLFPEYPGIDISTLDGEYGAQGAEAIRIPDMTDSPNRLGYRIAKAHIHWFEFCLTHLQQRLCKLLQEPIDSWNNKLIGKTYFYSQTENNHIIDYLYSEFKKLK